MLTGIDCDNGSEFINHDLIDWATHQTVFFTRSRPYKSNDHATIEPKNNHLVRRYGFYHRYDSPAELDLLNQLRTLVCDRLNFLTPTSGIRKHTRQLSVSQEKPSKAQPQLRGDSSTNPTVFLTLGRKNVSGVGMLLALSSV